MILKANSLTHEILQVLELGEAEQSAVEARLKSRFTPETVQLIGKHLQELRFVNLVVQSEATFSLTAEGRKECNRLTEKAQELARAKKVRANLLAVPVDTYNGAELRKVAVRPGALDYLKCPSIINGKPLK